jgi:hypothetical protein
LSCEDEKRVKLLAGSSILQMLNQMAIKPSLQLGPFLKKFHYKAMMQ